LLRGVWRVRRRGSRWALVVAVAVLGLSGTGCSGLFGRGGDEPHRAAQRVMERDLLDEYGLETEDVECESVTDARVGDTFECHATVGDREIPFVAEMVEDDGVLVEPDRLILPEDTVRELESVVGRLTADRDGVEVPSDNVDCGRPPVVANRHNEVGCTISDPVDGNEYEATVTFDESGELAGVEVARQPHAAVT